MMRKKDSEGSASGGSKPSIASYGRGVSSRLLGGGGSTGKKSSILGELLRSVVPPWVGQLQDAGMSADAEKKLRVEASACGLCNTSLKSAKELEPNNKKVCRCCSIVVCRQCAVHVHVLGHLRRRYVCFKCIGEAAVAAKLVAPVVIVQTVENTIDTKAPPVPAKQPEAVAETPEQIIVENESMLTSFVSRLWDTWGGWGKSGEPLSELEEEVFSPEIEEQAPIELPPGTRARRMSTGQEKMDRMNVLLAGSHGKFDGDALKSLLEISHGFQGNSTLVLSVPFTQACKEVIKLMAGLGKAFEFAGSDMNDKLEIMSFRTEEVAKLANLPISDVTLQMMVEREIKNKTTHAGKRAQGATRTIVRLLWFLDFLDVLLTKLATEQKSPLSTILSATYEETLGPRHVWVLRKIVRAGMGMVPEKKHFIPKLGLDGFSEEEQASKMKSWVVPVKAVRTDMWSYMGSKGLLDIP